MTTDIRAALDAAELALSQGDSHAARQRIAAARAVLAAEPAGEGPSDEEITLQAGKFLAYSDAHMGDPARWEGSDADLLAFARAVLPQPARPAAPPTPEPPAEALAARPLLEQVARLGDCIGANTVGQIMAISSRAAAWLEENPSGQPVAIEPRGCPTPGACSCVEPASAAPKPGEVGELVEWLESHAAHLRKMEEIGALPKTELTEMLDRAATLLQQQQHSLKLALKAQLDLLMEQSPAPAPAAPEPGEVEELVARLRDWHSIPLLQERERIATLLSQLSAPAPAVVPVALAERLPGEGGIAPHGPTSRRQSPGAGLGNTLTDGNGCSSACWA